MELRDLIKTLGGSGQVAQAVGVTPSAVSHWIADGEIPAGRRLAVWRMAQAAGVDWTPHEVSGLRLVPEGAAA